MNEISRTIDMDRFCRDLVEATPDAVIYADERGEIAVWNQGAARIFGYAPEEALGASLDIIIPERLRARHWSGYERTLQTGGTRYGAGDLLTVPATRKDGSIISVAFTIVPMRNGRGQIRGIGAILRDVTKQFVQLKQLRKLAALERP